jgi:hypothetical protein
LSARIPARTGGSVRTGIFAARVGHPCPSLLAANPDPDASVQSSLRGSRLVVYALEKQ